MTESVARLRGDQLTLGYGSYTVEQKTLMFRFRTAILPPSSALTAAASRRCYVR